MKLIKINIKDLQLNKNIIFINSSHISKKIFRLNLMKYFEII